METDRRAFPDRRRRATPLLSRYWLVGRRRGARRAEESDNLYVDRYTPGEWGLVAAILALSCADLEFTLRHLGRGGSEANPLMAWLLGFGADTFGLVKIATTLAGLFLLLLHVRFRHVRALLTFTAGLYAALMVWHAYVGFAGGA
jgi:hypothetical protein